MSRYALAFLVKYMKGEFILEDLVDWSTEGTPIAECIKQDDPPDECLGVSLEFAWYRIFETKQTWEDSTPTQRQLLLLFLLSLCSEEKS